MSEQNASQPVPLGELIELKRGYDLPSRLRQSGSIPIVSSSGVSGYHNEAKCIGPGVITGRYGTLGKVFFNTSSYWPLNTTLYVRDFKGNDPRFIYYLLSSLDFNAYSDKAAVPGLNRNDLHIIDVVRPPLPEQKRIAHILGSLDDKIELNRQMNETLEAMAQALFQDWFVDFGPTRAKMKGRAPYLAPEIWELFPDTLGEDGVPVGWERRPVGEFIDIKGGKQLEKSRIANDGIFPVFGGAGIMGYADHYNAEGFVIVVGRVGAYCGQFFSHQGKAWINNNASHIRQKSDTHSEWLFMSLCNCDIGSIKKGAAQPFVSNGDITTLLLIWPGAQIVETFTRQIKPFFLSADKHSQESKALVQARDALLTKLISNRPKFIRAAGIS